MANLYRKPITVTDPKTGQKKTVDSKKWYGRYVDADGTERRVVLAGDKKIAQRKLDELVLAAEQGRLGDPVAQASKTPVWKHRADFEDHLNAKNNTTLHIRQTVRQIDHFLETMRVQELAKIKAASVESFIAKLRKEQNLSLETCNHYIRSLKSFCNWLVKTNRMIKSPLLTITKFNADTDRRHARRPLDAEEFRRLIDVAENGVAVESISGPDRVMFYILAAWTGFRKGELGSITLRSFSLDADYPTLRIAAGYSKRRREDVLYLHPDVVTKLRAWLKRKVPSGDEILFPVSAKTCGVERKTADMMKHDLEIARAEWISEAETPDEREKRERSDFLKYVDSGGRYADFHGLRHTFVTNLAKSNVSPKTAQTLARHSDINLTMKIYTHVAPEEQASAINALPGLK